MSSLGTFATISGICLVLVAFFVIAMKVAKRKGRLEERVEAQDEAIQAVQDKKLRDRRLSRDPGLVERVRKWSRGA